MEMCKMLVLSTAHVSNDTAELLNRECERNAEYYKYAGMVVRPSCSQLNCANTAFAWLVCVSGEHDEAYPTDLRKVLEFAKQHGADWVSLDCEGDTIDELETYDW